MKFKFLFLFLFVTAFLKLEAGESDTVWTRDLWQLGSQINQVQFMPDGKNIAVCIGGGVYIFEIKSGQIIKQFNKYMLQCRSFTFSEDGKNLITSSDEDWGQGYKIIVWDYEKEDTIRIFNDISIFNIQSIDSNTIIGLGNAKIYNSDSSKITSFNFRTGSILRNIEANGSHYLTPFRIHNEKNLFTFVNVFNDNLRYIELWDLNTLKNITTFGSHDSQVKDLAFSSDGKYLASASSDGIVKIWDLETKKLFKTISHDTMENAYSAINFSPKSRFLVTTGGAGSKAAPFTTKIWDMKTFNIIYSYTFGLGSYYHFDINSDSSIIGVGRGRRLMLLNAHWSPVGVEEPKDNLVQILYPNPAGNQITIPIENGISPMSVKVSNINGQIFLTNNQVEPLLTEMRVDISSLISGTYFVSIIYPQKTVTYKFEKIR